MGVTPSEVQSWLEWAGMRLLAMPGQNPFPASQRALWPDYPQDANTAYGYTDVPLRAGRPTKAEIPIVDEILTLPLLVQNQTERRIVQARSLVTPISQRYLYSWSKIARMLHTDRRAVIRWHMHGLRDIIIRVDNDTVRKITLIVYGEPQVSKGYPLATSD